MDRGVRFTQLNVYAEKIVVCAFLVLASLTPKPAKILKFNRKTGLF